MTTGSVRLYLTQLNGGVVVLTLLMFCLLLKLGFWQIERATEKEQRLARIKQLSEQAAITVTDALQLSSVLGDMNDLPVMVEGMVDNEHIFLLDNKVSERQLGYHVLQVIDNSEYSVLVNLGWVKGSVNRNELPIIQPHNNKQIALGRIRLIEKGIVLAEPNYQEVSWPFRVQQIDLNAFSLLINKPLLPFVVYLDEASALGFKKTWQPIVMPPEKHRAYAFQWFSLALAWLILMLSASRWFAHNKQNKD